MTDKTFADGLRVDRNEKAPDFVICQLGVNVATFTDFLTKHQKQSGWVNLDVKKSKNGKYYAELNDWTPEQRVTNEEAREAVEDGIDPSEVPF